MFVTGYRSRGWRGDWWVVRRLTAGGDLRGQRAAGSGRRGFLGL